MNEELVQAVAEQVSALLRQREETMPAAFLVGKAPAESLGYRYVTAPPYSAVVIGALSYGQLLHFREESVFSALADGIPVYLWAQGLPHKSRPCRSRPLLARLSAAERELRALGIVFLDKDTHRRFISGAEAQRLVRSGAPIPAGAVLSPLARDILEKGGPL